MKKDDSKLRMLESALRISRRLSIVFLASSLFFHVTKGVLSLYFPAFLSFLSYLILKRTLKKVHADRARPQITQAQLDSLLRIDGGKASAIRLAEVTGADMESAKKFLDAAVLEGSLDIEAAETELIYTRRL